MTFHEFNALDKDEATGYLTACCGSKNWVRQMMDAMPFSGTVELVQKAAEIWYDRCNKEDWREAFLHHPKIGDVKSLKEKFASTAHLAGSEQASVSVASDEVIDRLAAANQEYEKKNGFIFIVSATGKSAAEMLAILMERKENETEDELNIAMGEQHKITLLRLQKQFAEDWRSLKVSQLTTHVLDTASGKPAAGISIILSSASGNAIAHGLTNTDGRIPDLLPSERILPAGIYKMKFETGDYFHALNQKSFYPHAEIVFEIFDSSHYHIPLLLSPYGYTTYRGS